MGDNYANPQFGLSMAAEEFSLSESYFSQFFKNIMGQVFSTYLEEVRLQRACALIEEGGQDLETIAEQIGYSNSASFRRAFKRVYGVAPSGWKKNQ